MKVLYIIDYGTVGGATHSFLELVTQMKKFGVYPVVCLGQETEIIQHLDKEGIEYLCTGHKTVLEADFDKRKLWTRAFWKQVIRFYIRDSKAMRIINNIDMSSIDLIHTNSARNDIGCYISKKYGIPHVMHIREFADTDFNCISYRPNYISVFNHYTSVFISISDAVKKHWIKKGIREDKVVTIYNGVHYEDIAVSSDNDKRLPDMHLIIAGGVFPAKGQHLAVEALGLLPEKVRNHIFIDVVGWYSEEYVQMMKNHASALGYEKQVKFLGSINDVHERMGKYQIGLMCSRAEGFGRVTAEYMHGRLGVIASNSGANPELIEDGVTGLLFKSGDANSLCGCILRFYNDRELLIRLSNTAQKKARALFTQQKNAESIYELYKKVLK